MATETKRGASILRDLNGALGDFGTLVAYVAAVLAISHLNVAGVLGGFGVMMIASGAFYGVPMAVQPMKAVAAAILTADLSPQDIATTGLLLGLALLVLAVSGGITRVARAIPQSVVTGLQLGLGLSLAWLGTKLLAEAPLTGVVSLLLFIAATRITIIPLLPLLLAAAIIYFFSFASDGVSGPALPDLGGFVFTPSALDNLGGVLQSAVLPQIALTLTNAIIVTAAVSRSLFGDRAARATERNLALTTALGNLALTPFGALPMCHGAGGVTAQARFGATTGWAPIMLGCVLLIVGMFFSADTVALLTAVPAAAAGALLLIAAFDLAVSKRLFDARPDCWPAIAATAVATLLIDPLSGLLVGVVMETSRALTYRIRRRVGHKQ